MFGNHRSLLYRTVIVGDQDVKKSGKAVRKCPFYMGYHVNILQCMQPSFLLTGQVYPMLTSFVVVPHEKEPFQIDCKIFSEKRCFHFSA